MKNRDWLADPQTLQVETRCRVCCCGSVKLWRAAGKTWNGLGGGVGVLLWRNEGEGFDRAGMYKEILIELCSIWAV